MEKKMEKFTKYERARILGARALQISMDAPILIKIDKEELESLNYDPLRMAEKEFESGVLPITVDRPMPLKIEAKLKTINKEKLVTNNEEQPAEEIVEDLVVTDESEEEVSDLSGGSEELE